MNQPPPWKSLAVTAYRWTTWPWRWLDLKYSTRMGRVPISIIYYHRVDDDCLNDWTISLRQFRRQLDWLQSSFELISLAEAQRRMIAGRNCRPAVCVTFDDGYADNCASALPLLVRRKVPVTYFVTAHHILNQQPFPHDVQWGRPLAPNTVESLRALARSGVEIGAHSRYHTDLGTLVDTRLLYDEVVTASRELESAIGQRIRYFAFPYGMPANLHPQVFQLAHAAGFSAVCSAYGGFNEIGGDHFHLQRFHADPRTAYLRNWLTLDPRKRRVPRYPYRLVTAAAETGRRPVVATSRDGAPTA